MDLTQDSENRKGSVDPDRLRVERAIVSAWYRGDRKSLQANVLAYANVFGPVPERFRRLLGRRSPRSAELFERALRLERRARTPMRVQAALAMRSHAGWRAQRERGQITKALRLAELADLMPDIARRFLEGRPLRESPEFDRLLAIGPARWPEEFHEEDALIRVQRRVTTPAALAAESTRLRQLASLRLRVARELAPRAFWAASHTHLATPRAIGRSRARRRPRRTRSATKLCGDSGDGEPPVPPAPAEVAPRLEGGAP
jgi:hypothetical protein